MKLMFNEYIKSLLIIFLLIILFSLIVNLLYYFDIINNNTIKYFKMLLLLLSFFLGGIYMGKHSNNKGYLKGLKLSLLVIILFLIFGFIFHNLDYKRLIYYFITAICITFGAMLGINKKIDNNNN